ncbi:succinylglutamate desuccinylase [Kalamiella sp. sgz302252]|uniref:succinylglutamate desuccinylase n=1 Tax=Pantoea sp. sgz302252 TaxID=3341827 RepID=UPI0036D25F4B
MTSSAKKREAIIDDLLNCRLRDARFPAALQATWLDEGVLQLIPEHPTGAVVVSAGIHGNETAPVEMLGALLASLIAGEQPLSQALLLIFGNLPALRAGKRYLHSDMNRLFGGRHRDAAPGNESRRAAQLEKATDAFFQRAGGPRYHLDMHTAIRASRFPQFALIPCHQHSYSKAFYALLEACELDAVVQHTAPGGTFSHYVSETFGAQSCTLELGKALPFGQNDLSRFAATDSAIRALLADKPLSTRTRPPMHFFTVAESIIKTSSGFRLNLDPETENFTRLPAGYVIACEADKTWQVDDAAPWILFPNAGVAPGLRAGLLLKPGCSPQN